MNRMKKKRRNKTSYLIIFSANRYEYLVCIHKNNKKITLFRGWTLIERLRCSTKGVVPSGECFVHYCFLLLNLFINLQLSHYINTPLNIDDKLTMHRGRWWSIARYKVAIITHQYIFYMDCWHANIIIYKNIYAVYIYSHIEFNNRKIFHILYKDV